MHTYNIATSESYVKFFAMFFEKIVSKPPSGVLGLFLHKA
jgi:hypothetical protein